MEGTGIAGPESMIRILFLLAAGLSISTWALSAQDLTHSITLGVKAGTVLSDTSFSNSIYSAVESGKWSGGPSIEFRLPYRFSLEVDALYQSQRQTATYGFSILATPNGDPVPTLFNTQTRT